MKMESEAARCERACGKGSLVLQPLAATDGENVYSMLQGIDQNENGFENPVQGMPREDYAAWLVRYEAYSRGENMPDWMVPETIYWLMDGDTPVGCGHLRHMLNDALREGSGHIGYAIAKPFRGKGYGNAILALLLQEARKIGIERVQVRANTDNERSNKVIRANGGVMYREKEGKNYYHIDLDV